jgi:NAD(P)-dependent dehydrogenase (short-subunit alcohol dehydrogenase family)
VNVVAPGATKTPIWKRGVRANATAEESAKVSDLFSSTVPLARWGEPEDLAKAVLFLASDGVMGVLPFQRQRSIGRTKDYSFHHGREAHLSPTARR